MKKFSLVFGSAAALFGGLVTASAATVTWDDGGGDGLWITGANTLTIDSADVDPNADGTDFYRVRE